MPTPFTARAGAVFSADIAVPEHEREVAFYKAVLSTGEAPLWREADLMNNLGMPIVGLGARSAEMEALPLQWMPHFQVVDVAASAAAAAAAGGRVLMQSGDGDGSGGWAVFEDPQGAAFGLVAIPSPETMAQVAAALPEDEEAPVGRIAWLDLTVADAASLRDFYREVIGWSVQDVPMQDGEVAYADYLMTSDDGDGLAGVCFARGMNAGLPPVWMLYLPVGDLDESLRRVEAGGGRLLAPARGEGAQRYAFVADPVGVVFALMQG